MQGTKDKIQRPMAPRTPQRNSVLNTTKMNNQRSNSAKAVPSSEPPVRRNIVAGKVRSNSARITRPEALPETEDLDEPDVPEEHKNQCPRRKGCSRSKYRLNVSESNPGLLHPKPWGARNPTEIPCICNFVKERDPSSVRAARSPSRLQDILTRHERQASRTKVTEILSALCSILDRKKITITDTELNFLIEKMKEKLQKYKEQKTQQPPQQQTKQQRGQKAQLQEEAMSPTRRQRTAQSLAPVPQSNYRGVSKENLGDHARANAAPVLGKVETKKYFIELTSEDQVPTDFKHIFGMMNPHHRQDKQVLLMEDSVIPVEEGRQYAVVNKGLQLRHHAENTTLLLSNQDIAHNNVRLKALPASMVTAHQQLTTSNTKSRR